MPEARERQHWVARVGDKYSNGGFGARSARDSDFGMQQLNVERGRGGGEPILATEMRRETVRFAGKSTALSVVGEESPSLWPRQGG